MSNSRHKSLTQKEHDLLDKIEGLYMQSETIKDKFSESLDNAHKQVDLLTIKIEELKEQQQEIYTMYMLGEVEITAYKDKQKELNEAKELLQLTQDSMKDFAQVEEDEIYSSVWHDLEPLMRDFQQTRNKSQANTYNDMLQARDEYLAKLSELYKTHRQVERFDRLIERVEVGAGLKENHYVQLKDTVFPFLSNIHLRKKGVDISENIIRKVLK